MTTPTPTSRTIPPPNPPPTTVNITLLDGGISRELTRISAPFRLPEWTAFSLIHAPEKVHQIHQEFIRAGAQVLTTNSYSLVPDAIGESSFPDRAEQLAALSGELARSAADECFAQTGREVVVAGSLGPVFGSYEPLNFKADRVQGYLGPVVRGLEGYVDIWLGETLSLLAEGDAVLDAVRNTGKPVWVSFTLDPATGALRSGESVRDAARWAVENKVEALLFNCAPPEIMSKALREAVAMMNELSEEKRVKLGVYANAFEVEGQEYEDNGVISRVREDLGPGRYTDFAREWVEIGARIVGGCCGVGCEHVKVLAARFGRDGNGN